MARPAKAVIFDIDGTLLDSADGIVASFRHTLRTFGIKPPPENILRRDIGPPVANFLTEAGVPSGQLQEAVAIYRTHYGEHGMRRARPYPGIETMLERLNDLGIPLGTATAKRTDSAHAILDHHGLGHHFTAINGTTDTNIDKKHTVGVTLRQLANPHHRSVILVGDRGSDMTAAHHWGLTAAGATWGYGSARELIEARAVLLLENPQGLLQLISARTQGGAHP